MKEKPTLHIQRLSYRKHTTLSRITLPNGNQLSCLEPAKKTYNKNIYPCIKVGRYNLTASDRKTKLMKRHLRLGHKIMIRISGPEYLFPILFVIGQSPRKIKRCFLMPCFEVKEDAEHEYYGGKSIEAYKMFYNAIAPLLLDNKKVVCQID